MTNRPTSLRIEWLDEIAEHLYRGGASHDIYDVSCGMRCQEFWAAEQAEMPEQPGSHELIRELLAIRMRTRLLPTPTNDGRRRLNGSLADGKQVIGWKLGGPPKPVIRASPES